MNTQNNYHNPYKRNLAEVSNTAAGDGIPARLRDGVQALKLDVSEAELAKLWKLAQELLRWNKAINLTAVRDPQQAIDLHLLDSLTLAPYMAGQTVLDVGTGAGLPGLPLAILQPQRQFTLLDSAGKKLRFIQQMTVQLGLSNVKTVHGRVEAQQETVDCITTRAFAPLPRMLEWCGHLLAPGGRLLAMKGQFPDDEVDGIPPEYRLNAVIPLAIPGVDAERHLLEIVRADDQGASNA